MVERQRAGRPLLIAPDLAWGMGARLDTLSRTRKREQLLERALGVFDAVGVVRLRLHREADLASVSDLLVYSMEELEAVAEAKGGIRRLLDEKWVKVYKAGSQRDLFRGCLRRVQIVQRSGGHEGGAAMARRPYPTDLSTAEWAILEPLVPSPQPGGRPGAWSRREILDAICSLVRSGAAWRGVAAAAARPATLADGVALCPRVAQRRELGAAPHAAARGDAAGAGP